jgi:hypothetical protein
MDFSSSAAGKRIRWAAGLSFVGCLAACGSSPPSATPPTPLFATSDCSGHLVEIARLPGTPQFLSYGASPGGVLAIDGDTLYVASSPSEDSPNTSAEIVAVSTTGGSPRTVASGWPVDHFWVQDNVLYAQQGSALAVLPLSPTSVAQIPTTGSSSLGDYLLSDASYAYSAAIVPIRVPVADGQDPWDLALQLNRAPVTSGSATTLFQDSANYYDGLCGMADVGDALVVLATYSPYASYNYSTATHLLRVPKDGSRVSELRPDVRWAPCGGAPSRSWIAWTGTSLVAPVVAADAVRMASIPLAGGAPTILKGGGDDEEYAQRLGKVFTAFETWDKATEMGSRVFVDVFDGSTEAFLCGGELAAGVVGIAANATGTYVAYAVGPLSSRQTTVIARLP